MGYLKRTVDEAIAFAEKQHENPTQDWHNMCQSFVRQCYGVDAWNSSAKGAWYEIPDGQKHKGGHPDDAPRGAAIYFTAGTYGHVALAIGKETSDKCWSNDYVRDGKIDKCQREFSNWGMMSSYAGWSFWTPYGEMKPSTYWDGKYPSEAGSQLASDDASVRNPQAWRWACRMADLGWFSGVPQDNGEQGWPRKAVEKYQADCGYEVTGNYGPKLGKQIFGKELT
jgi:hypothetical protein